MMQNQEHIDDLLMAYLLNELSDEKVQEVEVWLAQNGENQKKFDEIVAIWEASQNAQEHNFDANVAWNKVSNKLAKKPFYHETWVRVAAAVVLIFGAASMLWNLSVSSSNAELYAQNEVVNEILEDGSEITLNVNSNLTISNGFNKNNREVTLKGEAFFDIERDESKPFIINLEQSKVTVLGTSFNINSTANDKLVRVFVKSGVVQFEYLPSDTSETYLAVKLHAGDKVVYNKETRQLEKVENGNSEGNVDMYWMNQELIFDGIELGQVSKILEAVYGVEIKITESQSEKCLLTANFQNAEIDQIMMVISTTFNLSLEQTGTKYVLNGLSCEEG